MHLPRPPIPPPFDRTACGLCGTTLTPYNAFWRIFPGVCVGCAPPGLYCRISGFRTEAERHTRPPRDAGRGQGIRTPNYSRVSVGGTPPHKIVVWHKPPEPQSQQEPVDA